jgi:hypothetical protein
MGPTDQSVGYYLDYLRLASLARRAADRAGGMQRHFRGYRQARSEIADSTGGVEKHLILGSRSPLPRRFARKGEILRLRLFEYPPQRFVALVDDFDNLRNKEARTEKPDIYGGCAVAQFIKI